MKVHLRMVGCRLNQSEIDSMARQFQGMGHEVVETPGRCGSFYLEHLRCNAGGEQDQS